MQGNLPSRTELDVLIRRAVEENIRLSNLSFDSYTARVSDFYLKNSTPSDEPFNFPRDDDAWGNNRKAAKKLRRYFDIDTRVKIPAVLVFSLIAALDDPWRSNVITQISDVFEYSVGDDRSSSSQAAMNNLLNESSDALAAFLKVSWDGLENDSVSSLKNVRIELLQLIDSAKNAMGLIEKELRSRKKSSLKPVA